MQLDLESAFEPAIESGNSQIRLRREKLIEARLATTEADRKAVYRLRYEVYVEEQGKGYPEADHKGRLLEDALDEFGRTLLAGIGDLPCATVRANPLSDPATMDRYGHLIDGADFFGIDNREIFICSRLAASNSHRNPRIQRELFSALYRCGTKWGARLVVAAVAEKLLPFFKRHAFREYSSPVIDPTVGKLHRTVLVMADLDLLKATRSPFYAVAQELNVQHKRETAVEYAIEKYHRSQSAFNGISDDWSVAINAVVDKARNRFARLLGTEAVGRQVTVVQYHRYLSMQYHLTKGVQRYFIAVAGHPDLSRMKSLRKFLLDFANEEEKHYLVAAQDLARMDLPILPPPFDAELWHAFFGTTVIERPFLRLGAACVLENISGGVAKPAVQAALSADFLNRSNTQFLTLHQHEARPHGDEILDALRAVVLPKHAISDLEEGARKGLVMYLRMAEWALVPTCDAAYADAHGFQLTSLDSDQISRFSMEELVN